MKNVNIHYRWCTNKKVMMFGWETPEEVLTQNIISIWILVLVVQNFGTLDFMKLDEKMTKETR